MNKFMQIAADEARSGIRAHHGGPFGAVITKDGAVVGRGHNEVIHRNDPTCHGEMMAIHDACKNLGTFDLSGCDIYTTAEPCPMCLGAILWANIGRVFYGCTVEDTDSIGFRDGRFYEIAASGSKDMLIMTDREECLKVFAEYSAGSHTGY
ncbi:MAG: nucleoside deaminase [Oscillospiraceae bacterium]|nr:nucleoside deaminase [Oscillospiraceae bacterium]